MSKSNKQLTSFWNLLSNHKIVIPIIQRDYAQGRDSEGSLRTRFLTQLKRALDSAVFDMEDADTPTESHQLILDFVYGTPITSGAIAPLDGQQRLTTLWLLHWYLAYISGALSNSDVKKVMKSFSYETRVSSRDFCEKLCDLPLHEGNNVAIKNHIENQTWFYSEWKQDPTVRGMLTMLFGNPENDLEDNIYAIFGQNKEVLKKYWNSLISSQKMQAPLMFNHTVIGTEELPLSDDLYIKMNARGKPLTNFENFKAEVVKWVSDNISKEESIRIASKFDNEWTDIFWEKGLGSVAHNVDELFFAFINRIYYQYLVTKRNNGYLDKDANKSNEYKYFSGGTYNSDKFISFQSLDIYLPHLKITLTSLEKVFQEIKDINQTVLQAKWNDNFYFIPQYILDTNNIPKSLSNDVLDFTTINQTERVAFYAIYKYFLSPSSDMDEANSLSHWMRFVWNLISDKDSGGSDTIRSFAAIQQAVALIDKIENPRRVYKEINERSIEFKQTLKSHVALERRFIEEIEKVSQILNPNPDTEVPVGVESWEQAIIMAEEFRFFNGSISVLFLNEQGEIDWVNFERKFNNAQKYFNVPNDSEIIQGMIPYLTDRELLFVFSSNSLHCNDDNVSDMLHRHPKYFHNYLMGEKTSDTLTRLQSDLISLCKNNPSFWIHNKWVGGKHVLSNFSYRSGSYESNSYFLDTDFIKDRYEFLKEAQSESTEIELILNKEYTYPYNGLFIDFTCVYLGRKYQFRWTGNDWVDMYDKGVNLWKEGLHSKFKCQEEEYHFDDVLTFLEEIRRCIDNFMSSRNDT